MFWNTARRSRQSEDNRTGTFTSLRKFVTETRHATVNRGASVSGMLQVEIVEAKDLKGADGILNLGRSDPYAVMHVGGNEFRTKTIKHTRNPHWNQSFSANVEGLRSFRIVVYDWDRFGSNDQIGYYVGNLSDFGPQLKDEWHNLIPRGVIHLRTSFRSVGGEQQAQPAQHQVEQSSDGTVYIKAIGGRDLLASDAGGTSDPYLVVRVRSREKQTKKKKRTLRPIWNEAFEFPASASDVVQFSVFDWDRMSKDDPLGNVAVRVGQMTTIPTEHWLSLDKKGQIHVELYYRGKGERQAQQRTAGQPEPQRPRQPQPQPQPQQYPQGYPPQGYPPQGYPPQGYPPQGYPPQGYPPQGYPPYPPHAGGPPGGHPYQYPPSPQHPPRPPAGAPPPPGGDGRAPAPYPYYPPPGYPPYPPSPGAAPVGYPPPGPQYQGGGRAQGQAPQPRGAGYSPEYPSAPV